MWCSTISGKFTVKSCYNLVLNRRLSAPNAVMEWKSSWTIKIPCRLLLFGWKIAMDCLWTKTNLTKHKISISHMVCPLCANGKESSLHLFYQCSIFRSTLLAVANVKLNAIIHHRPSKLINYCICLYNLQDDLLFVLKILILAEQIWIIRNNPIHGKIKDFSLSARVKRQFR